MVTVSYVPAFDRILNNLDTAMHSRVRKLIRKIITRPTIGKPMRHQRAGTREVYAKPFRVAYAYDSDQDKITFLDLYHKKKQ